MSPSEICITYINVRLNSWKVLQNVIYEIEGLVLFVHSVNLIAMILKWFYLNIAVFTYAAQQYTKLNAKAIAEL